jgi:hypothetical protein
MGFATTRAFFVALPPVLRSRIETQRHDGTTGCGGHLSAVVSSCHRGSLFDLQPGKTDDDTSVQLN